MAAVEDGSHSPRPVWIRIADDLAAAVDRGQHAPGTLLPSAAELAARYGVNRHTVRQALLHLQALGLVSVERGRGTTVVASKFPYRIGRRVSLRTNFGRAGVEVTGELLGAERRVATQAEAAALRIADAGEVWQVRTRSRAAGVVMSSGIHILSVDRFALFPDRLAACRVSISQAFRAYGITDYVRLETRLSASLATPSEAEALELPAGAPVMRSRALDGLPDGTPLQMADGVFAGDRVEMLIQAES